MERKARLSGFFWHITGAKGVQGILPGLHSGKRPGCLERLALYLEIRTLSCLKSFCFCTTNLHITTTQAMSTDQTSHNSSHGVHGLPEGSSSAIIGISAAKQTLIEPNQGIIGLDNDAKSANVEAIPPNNTDITSLSFASEDTVPLTSLGAVVTPGEDLQPDMDVSTHIQYDAQSALGHISVG